MIEGFAILAYLCFMGWTFNMAIDGSFFWGAITFLLMGIFIGAIIELAKSENKRGPCVSYETQMHFNAATKTMMPARVCVLRGEWIEEGEE